MQIGTLDIFIMAGFALWFLFPIGIYISSRKLYTNSDQEFQFKRNFGPFEPVNEVLLFKKKEKEHDLKKVG